MNILASVIQQFHEWQAQLALFQSEVTTWAPRALIAYIVVAGLARMVMLRLEMGFLGFLIKALAFGGGAAYLYSLYLKLGA